MILLFVLSLVSGSAFAEFKMPYIAEMTFNQGIDPSPENEVKIDNEDYHGVEAPVVEKLILLKYEIKEAPQGKILGELVGKGRLYADEFMFYPLGSKVGKAFKPNIDTSEKYPFHQVVDVKDKFVNLGAGPWGQVGWASMTFYPLIGERVFYFTIPGKEDWVEYLHSHSKQLYRRIISTKEINWESIHKGAMEKVKADDPIFKAGAKERYITKSLVRKSSVETDLVDLTNGELNLLSTKNEVTLSLFSTPDPESPLVGSLKFKRVGDTLNSVFTAPGKKEVPFKPSVYEGRCGLSVYYLALQEFTGVFQDFSQIGAGPWGKSAWVKARPFVPDYDIPEGEESESAASGPRSWMVRCKKPAPAIVTPTYEPHYIDFYETYVIYMLGKKGEPERSSVINIYASPNVDSEKIGAISIYVKNEKVSLYVVDKKGVSAVFEPNELKGFCNTKDGGRNFLIQSTLPGPNNWSNLGRGDWGEVGWVNIASSSLLKTELELEFRGRPGHGHPSGMVGDRVKFFAYNVSPEDNEKLVPLRDLVDSEGSYRFHILCSQAFELEKEDYDETKEASGEEFDTSEDYSEEGSHEE